MHRRTMKHSAMMCAQVYYGMGCVYHFFWWEHLTLEIRTCATGATGMGSPAAGLAACLAAALPDGNRPCGGVGQRVWSPLRQTVCRRNIGCEMHLPVKDVGRSRCPIHSHRIPPHRLAGQCPPT